MPVTLQDSTDSAELIRLLRKENKKLERKVLGFKACDDSDYINPLRVWCNVSYAGKDQYPARRDIWMEYATGANDTKA